MSDQTDTPLGSIRIEVPAASFFLSGALPIEVRDAAKRLVARLQGNSTVPVPPGLYSVDVLMPNGRRESQLVRVEPGEDAPLRFSYEVTEPLETVRARRIRLTPGPSEVALVSMDGCTLRAEDGGAWVFEPAENLEAVPVARFSVKSRPVEISLPLNSSGAYPLNACTVVAEPTMAGFRLRTSFAPERQVSVALDGMLRSGEFLHGLNVMREATELLLYKYEDPPGAALGALVLHRIGHLEERSGWVENLARDFPWIPDGAILLAALLQRDNDGDERNRGLGALLAATEKRPLFTDGLSLAMELLRRWEDEASKTVRFDHLKLLSEFSVDWGALNLTDWPEGDGSP